MPVLATVLFGKIVFYPRLTEKVAEDVKGNIAAWKDWGVHALTFGQP